MKTLLSVLIPCYNAEKYIAETLGSVREQYRDGLEVIVIDDGSTDRSMEIARAFAGSFPLRILTPGRFGSAEVVTNIGLREASGEWACLLHSDDYWLPGRMDRIWREMESARGALIVHDAMYVGPQGQKLGALTCPLTEGDVASEMFMEHLLVQNFIAPPSPVFRREAAVGSGGMDQSIWICPDWDLWLRMGQLGPIRHIAQRLSAYRIHAGAQTVASKRRAGETERQLTTVLDRHLEPWPRTGKSRAAVERVAKASIRVNSVLSAAFSKEPTRPFALFFELLSLGPSRWHRYFRDSRIVERVSARLKVRRVLKP